MDGVVLPEITEAVRPIYLDKACELYCVVDKEDYDFLMQWKWKAIKSRGKKVKWYAYRTSRWRGRHVAYFLHKIVCFRANGLPPSVDHIVADHQDGNSLMDTRINLQWATRSENAKNRHGVAWQQLQLAVSTQNPARVLTGEKRTI